jgi:hypothetical protein
MPAREKRMKRRTRCFCLCSSSKDSEDGEKLEVNLRSFFLTLCVVSLSAEAAEEAAEETTGAASEVEVEEETEEGF